MTASSLDALALEAEALAKRIALSPEAPKRFWRTERVWSYRAYQGGEQASQIDWRQSARGDKLLVRQAEALHFRPLYLYSAFAAGDDAPEARQAGLLLGALGYLLLKAERQIGWLKPPLRKTRTSSLWRGLLPDVWAAPALEGAGPPEAPELCESVVVLAKGALESETLWVERLKAYAARNNRGLLLDFAPAGSMGAVAEALARMGWPTVRAASGAPPEPALLLLFEEALKASG